MSDIEAAFDRLAAATPATLGIAIVSETGLLSFGNWTSGVAWSTIKVPLAIAALRADPETESLVVEAIVDSDNQASEALWSKLGPAAAAQVQAVIAECGDTETVVEAQRLRGGYTPFGQTRWALGRQARFAKHLPTLKTPVSELMRTLTEEHRWGLAAKGYAAKGGWGPGTDGTYLVRQFGFTAIESGHLGVALAAEARTFEAGVEAVDALADWLDKHLPH
jgi:hypothetical protein